jgi:hypothetical protein
VKVVGDIQRTADGALLYDNVGGEPLGVRLIHTDNHWKQFHLYRRVPDSGQMTVTVALTGTGVVYYDDLRIEPLLPKAQGSDYGPRTAPVTTTGGATPLPTGSTAQPANVRRPW